MNSFLTVKKQAYRIGMILFSMFYVSTVMWADNLITQVKSPDNTIVFELLLNDANALCYRIAKGGENLVDKSKLGINTSVGDFSAGLTHDALTPQFVDDTYSLPSGKKSTYVNRYNQTVATFNKSGRQLQLIIRVYNDGIAYRYALDGTGEVTIYSEQSECGVSSIEQVYSQVYSKNYKNIIEESNWAVTSCMGHTSLPLLLKTGDNYLLLAEAMVNGTYAASQLVINDETQALAYRPVGEVTTALPFQSPWRTMMIGSLSSITESVLPENLNGHTTMDDVSWIKPGRAAWNYAGEDTAGYLSFDNICRYIDWASDMSWEYFTLDRGWQNNNRFTLQQVVNYADSKNVGVFVWVNQQTLYFDKNSLKGILQAWKNQGVKGIKIDFWEDDSQVMMKKYDLLLEVAAEVKLMVNLYSCTKPTGLRRTWPHLLTSEAVLSNSYYAESPAVVSSVHNINSAIVRGALGPVDYAPVDFADKRGKIINGNTWAHQLALAVVFESGIQHIIDAPDNLKYNIANGFLKKLPAAWDDTQCLEAEMEKHITIARRKGNDWYVASLTNNERVFQTLLSFLPEGNTYNAYIYMDGDCPSEIKFEYRENLRATDNITLPMAKDGGFVMVLSQSMTHNRPFQIKYEAESPHNTIPFGVAVKTDEDSLCSNGRYITSVGNGRAVTFNNITVPQSGTYAVTFYYMALTDRYAYVKVNNANESWTEYSFYKTGDETGWGMGLKTITAELKAGIENTIEFGNNNDYAPSLDRIVVSQTDGLSTGLTPPEDVKTPGKIYVVNREVIMEQSQFATYSIYNVLGQLIASGEFYEEAVSVPLTTDGIYIVNVNTNGHDFSKKIILK